MPTPVAKWKRLGHEQTQRPKLTQDKTAHPPGPESALRGEPGHSQVGWQDMEFDGSVCRLQGSLLGFGRELDDKQIVEQISRVFQAEEKSQHHKLFVCLMLNCDHNDLAVLCSSKNEYAPFGDLFGKPLDRRVFLQIVERNDLWTFLRQAVQSEGVAASDALVDLALEHRDEVLENVNDKIFLLTASKLLAARKHFHDPVKNALLLAFFLDCNQNVGRPSRSLLQILHLLLLRSTDDEALLCTLGTGPFGSPDFGEDFSVAALGERFVNVAGSLSVSDWCETVEESSEEFLSLVPAMRTWFRQGFDTVPSNAQRLISHYAHLVAEALQKHPLNIDEKALSLMKQLGKKYDPVVELNLEDKTVAEVVNEVARCCDDDWKLNAYLNHLCSEGAWKDALRNPDAMAFVERRSPPSHCRLFFDTLSSNDRPATSLSSLRNAFVKSLERVADLDFARRLLGSRLKELKSASDDDDATAAVFRRDGFVKDVRNFLNKVTAVDEEGTAAILVLAVQSPCELARLLVEDCVAAAANGKTKMLSALLTTELIDVLNLPAGGKDDGNGRLFFTSLVLKADGSEKNLVELVAAVARTGAALAADLSVALLDRMLKDDERTNACLPLLRESLSGAGSQFDPETRTAVVACLCHLASRLHQAGGGPDQRRLPNLSVLLHLLHDVLERGQRSLLKTRLHPDLRPYFFVPTSTEGRSFLQRIKSRLFDVASSGSNNFRVEEDDDDLDVELLSVLPDLIPDLWVVLIDAVPKAKLLRSLCVLAASFPAGERNAKVIAWQASFMAQRMKYDAGADPRSAMELFKLLCQLVASCSGEFDETTTSALDVCLINFVDGLLEAISSLGDDDHDQREQDDLLRQTFFWLCAMPESETKLVSMSKLRMYVVDHGRDPAESGGVENVVR